MLSLRFGAYARCRLAGELPVPSQGPLSEGVGVEGLGVGEVVELAPEPVEFGVGRFEISKSFFPTYVELRPRPFGLPAPVVTGPGLTTCRAK
jgi:hypothetical protein